MENRAQASDAYDDVELPYPDAKVLANELCICGPCFYLLPGEQGNDGDNDANLSLMIKTFLLTHMVPNMRRRMSASCSFILEKALLWLVCSPNNFSTQDSCKRINRCELNEILPARLTTRISTLSKSSCYCFW